MKQYQRSKMPHPAAHHAIHWLWKTINDEQTSQEDVARRAGVSASAMRKWRRGDRSPNLSDVEACLNVFSYTLKPRYMKGVGDE